MWYLGVNPSIKIIPKLRFIRQSKIFQKKFLHYLKKNILALIQKNDLLILIQLTKLRQSSLDVQFNY